MSDKTKTFSSKALEVNLSETREEKVVLPPEHQWFGELSKDQWGIYKRTQEFLEELNHKYRNYDVVLESLQRICLGDLWIYNNHPESMKAFTVLLDIIKSMMATLEDEGQRGRLIQILLRFIDRLVILDDFPEEIVDMALDFMADDMSRDPLLYAINSGYFRTYLERVASMAPFREKVTRLTGRALDKTIQYWEETSQVEKWYRSRQDLFNQMTYDDISAIGERFFRDLHKKRMSAKDFSEMKSLMFFNDISNYFRNFSGKFDSHLEAIYYLFYLIHLPGMNLLGDHLLYDLNRNLRNVFEDLSLEDTREFIDRVMEEFQELKIQHGSTVLDCIATLGSEIIALDDIDTIHHFNKSLIKLGFHSPGKVSLTEDWQIEIDATHVKNIRVWLDLIESDPPKMKELLAALILYLKLGGVFISDTDLFQRDVTKLLNADITYVYREIKQLARIFPVFFREIGAEGELRDVTTSVDELSNRKDRLIHFMRKQIHTESNNSHIHLTAQIIRYWFSGEKEVLREIVPENVFQLLNDFSPWFTKPHETLMALSHQLNAGADEMLELDISVIEDGLGRIPVEDNRDPKRVLGLFKVHALLKEKYSFESGDILDLLGGYKGLIYEDAQVLQTELAAGHSYKAVGTLFRIMNQLKTIILDPAQSEAVENIYYKRHIAAGIPSMYGEYWESKFDALGLTYRLERVSASLMSQVVQSFNLEYITAKSFRQIYDILILFRDGMQLDGIYNQGLNSHLDMLKFGLASPSFSVDQYINIFEFIADDIQQIIQEYFFDIFRRPMQRIIPRLCELDKDGDEDEYRKRYLIESEKILRDNLSNAFLVQDLDNFVTDIIGAFRTLVDTYSNEMIQSMTHFDPDLTFSSMLQSTEEIDNSVFLGAKAYFLKILKRYDFPIPEGFVITTEVFRHSNMIDLIPEIVRDLDLKIDRHIADIEQATGRAFGDPNKPLFFSVRSGSTISMPGAMKTFLNVGMNDDIAETFSKKKGAEWAAWDCYRRFLQSWGMAHGIHRDVFDKVMSDHKAVVGVTYKAQFSPSEIKELAYKYKQAVLDHNVKIIEDPFKQLKVAIRSVLDSWYSNTAVNYRSHMQIAQEWGTAVVVQKMVLGNLSSESGSGVVLTSSPFDGYSTLNLYGDFALRSQGEDIVSGLVNTLPITERQRKRHYNDSNISLELAFPEIFEALENHARRLINEYGFVHQEIEFTFESRDPKDLYILQTRNQNLKKKSVYRSFASSADTMHKVGSGIGVSTGILSGRVAFSMKDIENLKQKYPSGKIILIRPDTVPDDIPLIFACDGLVTAKGGVTSHAAVTAANIGKICIVKCKGLVVDDVAEQCTINEHTFLAGDEISIDGSIGSIYKGLYEIIEK